ncbi:MAG: undecaprenyl-diphosphate phosphatase [Planctomycetota bacterium]
MLESILKFTVLGCIQGLTEFFPVSSSGHLGLAEMLLHVQIGKEHGALVEVALHAGTLLAVLVFLKNDLLLLFRAAFRPSSVGPESLSDARGIMRGVFIATLPVGLLGIFYREKLESLFLAPWVIGCGFLATASVLILSRRLPQGRVKASAVPAWAALAVGCAQMMALVPGISRSGLTIVAGMTLGMVAKEAGRFSFLLAIPVIGGAAILKAGDIVHAPSAELIPLGVGVLTSFLFGLLALRYLTLLLRRGQLSCFAWYLVPLGLLTLYFSA